MRVLRVRYWPWMKRKRSARSAGTSKAIDTVSAVSRRHSRMVSGWKLGLVMGSGSLAAGRGPPPKPLNGI
jgi:hypothetical protein